MRRFSVLSTVNSIVEELRKGTETLAKNMTGNVYMNWKRVTICSCSSDDSAKKVQCCLEQSYIINNQKSNCGTIWSVYLF